MFTVNAQLHGYRQGHQLLDSTILLSKSDQSIVDRLSDVAGPLRPGELFNSYLSAYPLSSGRYYILARTWQDLTVKRAGCVRTLSIIISSEKWGKAGDLQPFLDLLDPRKFPSIATSADLGDASAAALPETLEFCASELLEALFLEEQKPVALFDAPSPELIAIRLLTAFWPTLRCSFALSTFALSPRKIEGRNFDLVFAPKNVRSRFSDWPGRRIDGRTVVAARHRWTDELVKRVFQSPVPRLLADRDLRVIGPNESGTSAALRIALLWGELLAKVERSPSAALGLLDIAKSRMQNHKGDVYELQPVLATAAQRAVESLPVMEAWELLRAMVSKIIGTPLMPSLRTIAESLVILTLRSPASAIAFLDQVGRTDTIDVLVPAVASGLAARYGPTAEQALAETRLPTFGRLVLANRQLARATLMSPSLVKRMEQLILGFDQHLKNELRDRITPAIVDDMHAILAQLLFPLLSAAEVLAEIEYLNSVNQFSARMLLPPLIDRARRLFIIEKVRSTILFLPPSAGGKEFLHLTLRPVVDDIRWLLQQTNLGTEATNGLLDDVIRQADVQQLQEFCADHSLAASLIERLAESRDFLIRVTVEGHLPLTLRIPLVLRLLPGCSETESRKLATDLLTDCLRAHFGGDESAALLILIANLRASVNVAWLVRLGLDRSLPSSVFNRNIFVFNESSRDVRKRILLAIEDLAEELAIRSPFDLTEVGAAACAALFWDARAVNSTGLLNGAGRLLPVLLRSGHLPVSAIIAATFPLIYRELAKEDDVPNVFKFVPFLDWDRCKAARHELVKTFLESNVWRAGDLALTACRSMDVRKILEQVAKSSRGETFIARIDADLERLPSSCRT